MRYPTKIKITVTFIRHGATEGNLKKKYTGRTDESLCKEGRAQIQDNAKNGRYPDPDILFSSPMKRCIETCAIAFPQKRINIIEDFKETDFGLFENKSYEELKDNSFYIEWLKSGGTLPFPQGESREDFNRRTQDGFRQVLDSVKTAGIVKSDKAVHICIVAHGGTIMSLMNHLTKEDFYSFQIKNGEIITVTDMLI